MKEIYFRKSDVALLGGVLLAGILMGVFLLSRGTAGNRVSVSVDGTLYGEYDLNRNQQVEIRSENGTNLLIIEDGTARMEEASCPDQLCVHMGKINRRGQSVICLPNKVVAEIRSDEDTGVDVYVK